MEHLFNIVLVILALQMPTTIHTLIVRDKSTNPPKIILSLKEISTENSDFDYRLYTSTNSIETLINHNNTFDLILE